MNFTGKAHLEETSKGIYRVARPWKTYGSQQREDVEKVSPCIYLKTVALLRQNMVRCTLTQKKEFVHRPVFQTINESRPPRTSSTIMHSGAEKQEGS